MRRIIAGLVGVAIVAGCATIPKRVVRDSQTYTLEILAGLQREKDASAALFAAADAAHEARQFAACRVYALPALVIDTKAQPQAYRALWLAGLPYPHADGTLPDPKVEQPDPGAAPRLPDDAVISYCLVDGPETDPVGLEQGGDNE